MNIFFSVNESGCAWWRAVQPARIIERLGLAGVRVFTQADVGRYEVVDLLSWCDIVVAQSPAGIESVALILKYQQEGKATIADYDDLVYSCSPFNPAYKTLGLKEVKVKAKDGRDYALWQDGREGFSLKDNYFRYRSQQDILTVADGITVTCDCLKKSYEEYIPEQVDKIHVLPNSIDFNLFKPFDKKEHKQLRIGWTASSSHLVEIWMVRRIMQRIFDKYGDKIKLVVLGDIKDTLKNFSKDELEIHQFVGLPVYPLKFASLEFDIGISPLENEEFNKNKSQLKWSEYSALRIPSIVSKLEPYSCVEDRVTGMVAKDENEFVDKLSELIENSKLREDIANNAYEKNFQDFNLEKNAKLWVEAYKKCLERAKST